MTDAEIKAIIGDLRSREDALPILDRIGSLDRKAADALDDLWQERSVKRMQIQDILYAMDELTSAMDDLRGEIDPD